MTADARLQLQPAVPADFEPLLALRIRAMQPSLEALGRFEPARARERFQGTFLPEHMRHIVRDGRCVGCVALRPKSTALRIDHLYIEPAEQRHGIGAWVMDWACAQADLKQVPLELSALQGSAANRFYLREGFRETGRSDFDIEYCRTPHRSPVEVVCQLWTRIQARDWVAARGLLHDTTTGRWWATGEVLQGADTFIAANAQYPEGWTIHVLQVAPLMDGRVLSFARVSHPPLDFLATSIFRVRDGLIRQIDEIWATCEEPPAWRNAERFPGIARMTPWTAA